MSVSKGVVVRISVALEASLGKDCTLSKVIANIVVALQHEGSG